MTKTLSSRDPSAEASENVQTLQELVFIVFDQVGIDEDPAEEEDDLVDQLEEGVMQLAEKHEILEISFAAAMSDLVSATVANDMLARDLRLAGTVVHGLCQPPWEDKLIDRCLMTVIREGRPTVSMSPADLKDRYTFEAEELREALRVAINEYNESLAEGILDGSFKVR